jgi:hypothetical protein
MHISEVQVLPPVSKVKLTGVYAWASEALADASSKYIRACARAFAAIDWSFIGVSFVHVCFAGGLQNGSKMRAAVDIVLAASGVGEQCVVFSQNLASLWLLKVGPVCC